MGANRLPTVTQGPWCTSTTTGTNIEGARLSVFRVVRLPGGREVFARGDHDGREFASVDECRAFALEHGYTELHYRRVWCPVHRRLHEFLGGPSPYLASAGCLEANHPELPQTDFATAHEARERRRALRAAPMLEPPGSLAKAVDRAIAAENRRYLEARAS